MSEVDEELKRKIFEYLDDLRDSGETNMWGAGPYVQEEFGLDRRTARTLCIRWMRTFEERHPKST